MLKSKSYGIVCKPEVYTPSRLEIGLKTAEEFL